MELTAARLFRARWSKDIEEEWIRSILKNNPDVDGKRIRLRCQQMNNYGRSVTGYRDLIPSLDLPDPDDRHVLAAAIVRRVDAIVTFNTKDFPKELINQYGIECLDPDTFLYHQYTLDQPKFLAAAKEVRGRLSRPKYNVEGYLDNLRKCNLPGIAEALENTKKII